MQPFIVTLCGLLLYRGLARFIANDDTKGFGTRQASRLLRDAGHRPVLLGIPMPFVLLIVVARRHVVSCCIARSTAAICLRSARNEEAARYSGINTQA